MQRSLLPTLLASATTLLFLPALPVHAQLNSLPQLGTTLPPTLVTGEKPKFCHTSSDHTDPCADVAIGGVRYTIAWDGQTRAITWLFTDDHHLVTDSGLAVGNDLRVGDGGQYDATVPYMKWFIDPKWKDTDAKVGSAVWYAVLHKDDFDRHFGQVTGFIQSRYIPVKQ